MNTKQIEFVTAVILLISLVLLLNPFDFWMPNMASMVLVAVFFVASAVFIAFVWRENPQDEREKLHRDVAGRWAFLIGSILLVIAIVVQSIAHALDVWLPIVLAGMILAKIAGYLQVNKNN